MTALIPTGNGPITLAAGPESIWVELHREDLLSRIDPATNTEVAVTDITIHCGVVIGGDSGWATHPRPGQVTRFDPITGETLETWDIADACGLVTDGDHLWVTSPGLGEVYELAPGTAEPLATYKLAPGIFGMALDPTWIWVAGEAAGGTLYRIDRASGAVETVGEFDFVDGVSVLLDAVWVSARSENRVWKLNPADGSIVAELEIDSPNGLIEHAGSLWTTSFDTDSLYQIDPATVQLIETHRLGYSSLGPPIAAFDSLWVAALERNLVLRIDPGG